MFWGGLQAAMLVVLTSLQSEAFHDEYGHREITPPLGTLNSQKALAYS